MGQGRLTRVLGGISAVPSMRKERRVAVRHLSDLKPKEKGTIVKVGGAGAVRRRMLDMGVVAGTSVEVIKVAPLGDPLDLLVRGYHLSLRKEEAREILVETP
jgi:Fe2+ transport system protein FeoA